MFRERNPSDPCLTVGLPYIVVYQICAVAPELQRKSSWVSLSSTEPNGNLNRESDVILAAFPKSFWLPRSCLMILLRSWRSQPQPGWPRRWPPPRGPWGRPGWPGRSRRSRRGAPARQPGRASAVTAQRLG